eukprot:scaffold5707_cov112-Cylindrotheca_fusiformis.AAC.6
MDHQQQEPPQTSNTTITSSMKRIISDEDVLLPIKKRVKREVLSPPTPSRQSPSELVHQLFTDNGWSCDDVISKVEKQLKAPTKEMISSYTMEVSKAVRDNDLERLRKLRDSGAMMNCCNKFGDTLLNIACRRSHTRIVKFLIEEANVPLYCRDDQGRVALHDALWTSQANLEIVEMLLKRAPELALLPDKRGHTPFDYARQNNWGQWIRFLSEQNALFPQSTGL